MQSGGKSGSFNTNVGKSHDQPLFSFHTANKCPLYGLFLSIFSAILCSLLVILCVCVSERERAGY